MNDNQRAEIIKLIEQNQPKGIKLINEKGIIASIIKDRVFLRVSDCAYCGKCCKDCEYILKEVSNNKTTYKCKIYRNRPIGCALDPEPLLSVDIDGCNIKYVEVI